MTKEQYADQLNQASSFGHSGMQKMGHSNSLSDSASALPSAESPLAYLEMGTGFIIGLAVGYFIKKSFKAVLFILGFALIITFYMESQGIFVINEQVLEQSISSGAEYMEYMVAAIKERITGFQSGVGAGTGFLVGIKIG
jgi:uncharacterized membrane protein (Fun14 family)